MEEWAPARRLRAVGAGPRATGAPAGADHPLGRVHPGLASALKQAALAGSGTRGPDRGGVEPN